MFVTRVMCCCYIRVMHAHASMWTAARVWYNCVCVGYFCNWVVGIGFCVYEQCYAVGICICIVDGMYGVEFLYVRKRYCSLT